jgi:hypothetical protein
MRLAGNRAAPAAPSIGWSGGVEMITKVTCPPASIGRVIVGPSKLRQSYFRIVSERGGSGRIEKFDRVTRTWSAAPDGVTFDEVWSAPVVPAVAWSQI